MEQKTLFIDAIYVKQMLFFRYTVLFLSIPLNSQVELVYRPVEMKKILRNGGGLMKKSWSTWLAG